MSIPGTVDVLLSPDAPLALRLTGQLLLGVVRIYAKKVAYLYQDCNDALVKIRLAFRHSQLELAPEGATAANHVITMREDLMEDVSLLLGGPTDGPAASSVMQRGLSGAEEGGDWADGMDGMMEVEVDMRGLSGSQGGVLKSTLRLRKGSALAAEAELPLTQRNSAAARLLRRSSQAPPVLEEEDEMFGEADGGGQRGREAG